MIPGTVQLADIEKYERQAVALAAQHEVLQNVFATVTGCSPGRISQVVAATDTELLGTLPSGRCAWFTA